MSAARWCVYSFNHPQVSRCALLLDEVGPGQQLPGGVIDPISHSGPRSSQPVVVSPKLNAEGIKDKGKTTRVDLSIQ